MGIVYPSVLCYAVTSTWAKVLILPGTIKRGPLILLAVKDFTLKNGGHRHSWVANSHLKGPMGGSPNREELAKI